MSTLETDGFLSKQIAEVEKTIAARYPEKWQLLTDTNRLTHRVIYSIHPHSQHVTELMLAALLIRQASAFQGFAILLGKGLFTQAQIVLRNLAEMIFITGAIRKDDQFVNQYVLAEDVSRVKSLDVPRRCRSGDRVARARTMARASITTMPVMAIGRSSSIGSTELMHGD